MQPSDARAWIASGEALERAVEADIRAELAAHLELAAEELCAEGLAPEEARTRAREHFGDLERTVRACRRAKLGGRTVIQRLNLAATVALLGVVVFFGLRSYELLHALVERSAALDQRVAALEAPADPEAAAAAPAPVEPGVIQVGDVVETLDRHRLIDFGDRQRVGADGKVLLVDLGWYAVAGLTRDELAARLTEAYSPYYQSLTVDVIVSKPSRPGRPALRDVVVELGDRVDVVSEYHPDDLSVSEQVAVDGTILLPEIGHLQVAGLTRPELETLLMEHYAPYYDLLDLKARIRKAE